jgi:crossover junction endodeoxyribonuclease RuvC
MSKPKNLKTRRVETILAIDPGIDRVGIAILDRVNNKETLLFSECFKTNPKDSQSIRLLQIGKRIREIITKWQPGALAIEKLFFNQNTTSAMRVSEARGVVLYEASRAGLKLREYSPQSIKIAITGYGKAHKIEMANMLKRLVNLPIRKTRRIDDEIDAIAVGITDLACHKTI